MLGSFQIGIRLSVLTEQCDRSKNSVDAAAGAVVCTHDSVHVDNLSYDVEVGTWYERDFQGALEGPFVVARLVENTFGAGACDSTGAVVACFPAIARDWWTFTETSAGVSIEATGVELHCFLPQILAARGDVFMTTVQLRRLAKGEHPFWMAAPTVVSAASAAINPRGRVTRAPARATSWSTTQARPGAAKSTLSLTRRGRV